MDASTRIVFAMLILVGSVNWSVSNAQSVDLAVKGFRSDVTVPISDLTRLSLEYYHLNSNQASALDFSAQVTNLGPDTAEDVLVNVEVFVSGVSQASFLSGTIAALPPGSSDTVSIDADWNAWSEVELVFHATSDAADTNETNDVDTVAMVVDISLAMRADDIWNDTVRCHLNDRIAVRYEFIEYADILGLWFVLPEQTELVQNLALAMVLDQDLNELMSVEVALYPSMFSEPGEMNGFWVLFPDVVTMQAGTDCYAALMSFDSTLVVAANGSCAAASVVQVNETGEEFIELDKLPLIGFIHYYESIPEQSLSGISMGQFVPDPAHISTRVSYTMRESGSPQIDLMRTDGSLVSATKLSNMAQGGHSYELDVSALPAGLYACSILLNGQRATKRFVVVH